MSELVEPWTCGGCGEQTSVRHFLQRCGVIVHDPAAAYREAIGLDEPESASPGVNGCTVPPETTEEKP